MANHAPIQVVIVDDHPLIRAAAQALLAGRENIQLVAEGCYGDDALLLVNQYRPDVLLLDISMPQSAAKPEVQFAILPAVDQLHDQFPQTKIIILSQYLQPALSHALAANKISGYLLKSDNLTLRLAETIEVVHSGGVYSSQEANQILAKPITINREALSGMQVKILTGLVEDPTISYHALANELGISINTFKWHMKNAFQILGVRSRSAAIALCIQNNLMPRSQNSYTRSDVVPSF
jgi:DNA-binding NarL/FixJ family response regulator